MAGVPGWGQLPSPYFQQEVNHRIEVKLDDATHTLHGDIETTYLNNSPDTLDFIWLHLWPNAYADGTSALAQQQFREGNLFLFWAMQRDRGGIDSLNFTVDGLPAEWSFHPEHLDIARLELAQPLAPGAQLTYTTPFRVKLPSGKISRLGHIGESYQITQWYPKPAVYDRDGWHPMPYLNQGEFYSEYGSFDVRITLPSNYVVGSTGDLDPSEADNAKELVFLDSLALATARRIDGSFFEESDFDEEAAMEFPPSSERTKTLRYRQSNVHDFAWFADKRWMVLKGGVELPGSGREVTAWAMFTPASARQWKSAPEYIEDATYYYSKWNGDYPYNHVTAVDGTISAGGGMEYPNVTVIGSSGSDLGLETVIVHEVGHNWFYGILGSNERTNAWMDEGINSFNETRYFTEKYGDKIGLVGFRSRGTPIMERLDLLDRSYASRDALAYLLSARMAVDQPMQCHSNDFSPINYGTVVYKKTAAAFDYLRHSLGTERFDAAMQAYFDAWKFKHPAPDDLRAAMESSTGEDLGWFFDDLVETTGVTNYALTRASESDSLRWTVRNRGDLAGPWSLHGLEGDSTWRALGWFEGVPAGEKRTLALPSGQFNALRIDHGGVMLEADGRNNTRRTSGLLRGLEPVDFGLLTRLEDGHRTQIGWLPVSGWNAYDGFMPGLAVHNTVLPLRDFEWLAVPMWSTQQSKPVGLARLSLKRGAWRYEGQVRAFSDADADGWFTSQFGRSELKAIRNFNRRPAEPARSSLTLQAIDVRQHVEYDAMLIDPWFAPVETQVRQALRADFEWETRRTNLEQSGRLRATWAGFASSWYNDNMLIAYKTPGLFPEMHETSLTLEATWEGELAVNDRGGKWTWRAFGGLVAGSPDAFGLQTMGLTGFEDVLRDHLALSRGEEGSWQDRIVAHEQGGIALLGGTDWNNHPMTRAVSVKLSRSLFAGIDAYAGAIWASGQDGASAGLEWDLRFAKLQVPLVSTPSFGASWFTIRNTTAPAVTLVLNWESLSPYQLLRSGRVIN